LSVTSANTISSRMRIASLSPQRRTTPKSAIIEGADHCPPSRRSPMRGPTVVDPGIGCKAHSGGFSPRRSAAIRAK
jgi:hypothetical protein